MAYTEQNSLETRQHNERVRILMTIGSNGGLALFGASTAVLYNGGEDDNMIAMAIISLALISGALLASRMLREEM